MRSSAEIKWPFQRNVQFLEDYLRTPVSVPPLQRQRVLAHVIAQPGCSLETLFLTTEGQVTRDEIYALIATGDIYIDLAATSLPEPTKVAVWLEKPPKADVDPVAESAKPPRAGTRLDWDGRAWTVINPGLSAVILRSAADEITELPASIFNEAILQRRIRVIGEVTDTADIQARLRSASQADLEEANRRFHIVSRDMHGEAHDAVPPRTLRRWIAAYRTGEGQDGNGYMGLLPKPNQGNTNGRLSEKAKSLMNEHIEKDYESLKQQTMYAVWVALQLACEREQIPTPSLKTFTAAVHQRAGAEQTQKRQGSRAAYQVQPFFWELEQRTPRHGDRPFEIGHIDHTQADVWAVCSQTGRLLGRPWLSLLTDTYSRRVFALHLTFDPPSCRSAMMIARECVCRHGRLPQMLVLDGGKEFDSLRRMDGGASRLVTVHLPLLVAVYWGWDGGCRELHRIHHPTRGGTRGRDRRAGQR